MSNFNYHSSLGERNSSLTTLEFVLIVKKVKYTFIKLALSPFIRIWWFVGVYVPTKNTPQAFIIKPMIKKIALE